MFSKKLGTLTIVLMAIVISACSPAPAEEPAESQAAADSQDGLTDPNAQLYRMFFDDEDGNVQVREFVGQLRLVDFEAVFDQVTKFEEDESGNLVAGPIYQEGHVWAARVSASGNSVNLISVAPDGAASSVLDLDGDRVADSVDIVLVDGRRYTFLTEAMGMPLLDDFLAGRNLCNDELIQEMGLEGDFWCDQESDSNGGGASGGGSGGFAGAGFVDPLDIVCAGFDTSNRARLIGASPVRTLLFSQSTNWINYGDDGSTVIVTSVNGNYNDGTVEHVSTRRVIYHYDGDENLIMRVDETVDANGDGTRTVTNYNDAGEVESVILPTPFKAKMKPGQLGQYDYDPSSPPPPDPHEDDEVESQDEERDYLPNEQPSDAGTGANENPGPDGDDSSVADFCARRGQVRGGVEEAAATDPTAIGVSCGELVGAPPTDDCSIIEWAKPDDFLGVLQPSGNNCGPFEEPDPTTGKCSGTDIESMLRGMTAAVASANLQGVSICGGTVCRPFDSIAAAAGNRQPISAEADSPPQVLSGTVRSDTLCWRGPGPGYEVVSSLFRDTVVVILGVGSDGGWLVVENPVFDGVPCWTPEDDIELAPDFDPESQTVFVVPSLPSSGGGDGGGGSSGGGGGTSPSAPAAPSNLAASVTCAYPTYSVKLTWKDNSNNESGFKIYRGGLLIATVGPNTTQFTDNNPPNSAGNNYSVRAYNVAGDSAAIAVKDAGCIF